MESRPISNFVADMLKRVSFLKEKRVNIQLVPEDKRAIALLVQLESDIECAKLNNLLIKFSKSNLLMTPKNLDEFYKFLDNRWKKRKKTDASPLLAPTSLINRRSSILSSQLPRNTNQQPYDIMMPTISSTSYSFPGRGDLNSLQLHEFILRDNDTVLNVSIGLEYLEYKEEKKTSSAKVFSDPEFQPLTLAEEQLVKHHSREAEQYADAISLKKDVRECKKNFIIAMANNDYEVTASYGEVGKNELVNGLLEEVKSREDLVKLMATYLSKTDWNLFLSTINKEALFKIILNIDLNELKAAHKNPEEYKIQWLSKTDAKILELPKSKIEFPDEMQLRAFIVCVLDAYKISRHEGPEFKSNTGYYIGYWFSMAFSKDDKIGAADVFRDFVLSGLPLTKASLEVYLKGKNLYDKFWAPLVSHCMVSNVFSSSLLPTIFQMAIDGAKQFEQPASQERHQQQRKTYGRFG